MPAPTSDPSPSIVLEEGKGREGRNKSRKGEEDTVIRQKKEMRCLEVCMQQMRVDEHHARVRQLMSTFALHTRLDTGLQSFPFAHRRCWCLFTKKNPLFFVPVVFERQQANAVASCCLRLHATGVAMLYLVGGIGKRRSVQTGENTCTCSPTEETGTLHVCWAHARRAIRRKCNICPTRSPYTCAEAHPG